MEIELQIYFSIYHFQDVEQSDNNRKKAESNSSLVSTMVKCC